VKPKLSTSFFLSLLIAANSFAEVGRTSAVSLTKAVAGRPSGLGEAYAGVAGDVDSISFNPAGVATLEDPALSATYLRGVADDNFGLITYGHPVAIGSFFIGGSYFDAGTIDLNLSDGTTGARHAERDTMGLIGFAVGRNGPLAAGISAKGIRLDLAEEAQATGYAADGGVLWRTPIDGLKVGAAFQNLGSGIKFEEEADPLPETTRVGIAYDLDLQRMKVFRVFPYKFLLAVDGVKQRDEKAGVNTGFEAKRRLTIADSSGYAALRAGYRSAVKALAFGVGFRVDNFLLDYGINLYKDDLSDYHRFTVSYLFSSSEESPQPENSSQRRHL